MLFSLFNLQLLEIRPAWREKKSHAAGLAGSLRTSVSVLSETQMLHRRRAGYSSSKSLGGPTTRQLDLQGEAGNVALYQRHDQDCIMTGNNSIFLYAIPLL